MTLAGRSLRCVGNARTTILDYDRQLVKRRHHACANCIANENGTYRPVGLVNLSMQLQQSSIHAEGRSNPSSFSVTGIGYSTIQYQYLFSPQDFCLQGLARGARVICKGSSILKAGDAATTFGDREVIIAVSRSDLAT